MNGAKIFLILFLIYSGEVLSQSEKYERKFETLFSFGISTQSFTDIFFIDRKYQRIQGSVGLGGSVNAEGFGLPLTIKFYSFGRNVGVTYEPIIRYDVVTPRSPFSSVGDPSPKDKYKLFADHHFSIYRKFRFSRKEKERNKYMGVGYSFISPGLSYNYDWVVINFTTGKVTSGSKVDLSFDGFHFLYGMKVYKRFHAEGKLMYIPPYRIIYMHDEAALMFFLKAAYQIPINRKDRVD